MTNDKEKRMSSRLGVKYYMLVGLGLGVAFSSFLALLYTDKTSLAETNVNELLAAPLVVLIMPAVIGLTIGITLLVFASGRRTGQNVHAPFGGKQPLLNAEVSALGFGMGIFLGPIAALVIFFFAPLPGRGFLSHILFGVLIGGAIGSMIGPLSQKIDQSLG